MNNIDVFEKLFYLIPFASVQHQSEPAADEDDSDFFVDPTPPQAGYDPVVGFPQMSLGDAVNAGSTQGGLHFPNDRFRFTGVVAEVEEKLNSEIREWQTRMQQYLVEVASQQQQQPDQQQQPQQQQIQHQQVQQQASVPVVPMPAQNGAQNEVLEEVVGQEEAAADHHVEPRPAAVARSSSQQRES